MMVEEPRHTTIKTNGINLHVARAGPEDGPLVVLLHGFPEPWFCWRKQIGPLAEAGFHVLAPDQRGYNQSDKPGRVSAYVPDVLADDVLGLLDAVGRPRAALVGHDWGGIVAWWFALRRPERVERLAILNAPHPVALRRGVWRHPTQFLRSWYVFFFQIPRLPEFHLSRGNWRPLAQSLRRTSRPGTFTDADLERYREAWSEPGAITAMIHWYRAALRYHPTPPSDPRVHAPTMVLWGVQDPFMDRWVAEAGIGLCDDGRLEWFETATHWVQHEEPERVNRLLLDFLVRSPERTPADPGGSVGAPGPRGD